MKKGAKRPPASWIAADVLARKRRHKRVTAQQREAKELMLYKWSLLSQKW
jgi:hypothetical protein